MVPRANDLSERVTLHRWAPPVKVFADQVQVRPAASVLPQSLVTASSYGHSSAVTLALVTLMAAVPTLLTVHSTRY